MKGFYVTGDNGSVLILEDGRYVDTFIEETSEAASQKRGDIEDILLRLLLEVTEELPVRHLPILPSYDGLNRTGFELYVGAA